MDHEEFRVKGKEMVDYIADYLENIRDRRVYPAVQPGYLHKLLPKQAPEQPEKWDDIFKDVESHIMPGIVHWQSPHMHAYFPALTSYPSILGEMLSSGLNVLCFTWASSPAGTELETIAMNWLGKALGLPDCFLNEKDNSPGGGVIQSTASEATLVSLLAARTSALMKLSKLNPEVQSAELLGHLICYCSDQAHSSVEKAGLIGLVRMRYIDSDENQSMRGDKLEEAILSDKAKGLVPFWVCATLGTTGSVAFDNLREIGEVCERHSAWLHVDAAYAGTAFFCPEYRHWLNGVELADSFAFNPSKWMMVNFDCTAMWVKDSTALHRTFNVNPIYLRHENSGKAIDYMHWQIPLSRRFRALKLWFVLRNYGISGLQKHVREGVRLAQKFEALILSDARFEVPQPRNLGLVVFRLKGDNTLTERLLKRLNARGHIHAVPACFKGTYVIRFTVTSPRTTNQDILDDWEEIKTVATEILREEFGSDDGNIVIPKKLRVSLKGFTNGDVPHVITSPVISRCILKQETKIIDPNQSHTLMTPSSQYISNYIDVSVPTLQLNDAEICFDIDTSEIKPTTTKTGTNKVTINGKTESNFIGNGVNEVKVNGNNGINSSKTDIQSVTVNGNNNIKFTQIGTNKIGQASVEKPNLRNFDQKDDKPNIGNRITQAFEHLYRQNDSDCKAETKKDDSNTKHTIRGPGLIHPIIN